MSSITSFNCDENILKLFPLKSISDVVQLFKIHLESAREPDLTLLSIVTGIIENTLTSKCNSTNVAGQSNSDVSVEHSLINNNKTSDIETDSTGKVNDSSNLTAASATSATTNFPVVNFETVQQLYDKFIKIISLIGECKRIGNNDIVNDNKVTTKSSRIAAAAAAAVQNNKNGNCVATPPIYATREIIKHVSDVIWNSLIRSTYKDRAHLQSLYSYLAGNKLDCFGVALAVVAGCQLLGYNDVHLAISEDHAWVVFGKTGEETIEVTWHGKGAEDKRGQSVIQGYESHSWLYLSGNPVVCDRYIEVAAIISSINPSLSMTSACSEVADFQQQLLWLLHDMKHLQRYPMGLGCLGELEEVSATPNRPSCSALYRAAVEAAQTNYKNHHVYPYTYQGGYYYRQQQYKDAFASWANAGDVIRLYNYSRDDEEIYKEFLDIANELIPHVMKTESSGHSAKSILRDPQCFANLLRFYDGICRWEEGSQTPILHIGWAKPLVTTISRFDGDIRSQVIIHCAKDDDDVNGSHVVTRHENNNNDISIVQNHENDQKIVEKNSKLTTDSLETTAQTVRTTLVEALTAACGEKILNPDFLLQGGGQPFAEQQNQQTKIECKTDNDDKFLLLTQTPSVDGNVEITDKLSSLTNSTIDTTNNQKSIDTNVVNGKDEIKEKEKLTTDILSPSLAGPIFNESLANDIVQPKRPEITLYSHKMKGLKDLLLAEKLNTHAISLQVTAQSQVQVGGKKSRHSSIGAINYATGTKRSRRD